MRAAFLPVLFAASGLAQTSLVVSAPAVLLNSSQARSLKVSATGGGVAKYSVEDAPSWLTTSSSNNYTTPDTLYFQLASSNCGTCSAMVRLSPAGGAALSIMVSFTLEATPVLTQLAVSPSAVNLNSTQARPLQVVAPKGTAVTYSVKNVPAWLTVTSAHNYRTPDTLYFQVAHSNCGACTVTLELLAAGETMPTTVPLTYGISAGASYRVTPSHVTLTHPAGAGTMCGAGYVSRCTVGMNSTAPSVKSYSAKTNPGAGDGWLLLNDRTGTVSGVPLENGLTLSVNPEGVASLATGLYSAQVVVFNPANQSDLVLVDVSLLVNPGKVGVAPDSGVGNSQTFSLQFPHPGGWEKLSVLNLLINNGLELARGCYLAYEVPIGALHLTDDQGNVQGAAGEIGMGKSGRNGQCGVRFVSAKGEGNLLTLTLDLTFSGGFAGKKTIYLVARDKEQNNSGWQVAGSWEIRPPAPVPVRKKSAPVRKKK